MSDESGTLAKLKGLLERLPGVSVVSTDAPPGNLALILKIERIESLGPVVYCADGSNVHLHIWTSAPPQPTEEHTNPTHLRYRVTTKNTDDRPHGAIEDLRFFGVFLAWHLHTVGALEANEANRLLTEWDGKLIPI